MELVHVRGPGENLTGGRPVEASKGGGTGRQARLWSPSYGLGLLTTTWCQGRGEEIPEGKPSATHPQNSARGRPEPFFDSLP